MFEKFTNTCLSAVLLALAFSGTANAAPSSGATSLTKAKPAAKSEAMAFARKMGIGWNLGNTLEATGQLKTAVSDYETLWGNPVTTKAMIDGIKASGFKSIRLPVAWSNLMEPDYTINKGLMARVEEVAKYALDNDMVVIINIHWDGGWISKFPTNYDESLKKYRAVWSQIAERFKGYSDHLIFESLNEESDFGSLWNKYSNKPEGKDKAYGLLNTINQEFTTLIRASGGNNAKRYLLLAGYTTDIKLTVDPAFQMPLDPAARSMVSVHYYTPSTFTLLEKDADWGKAAFTWGTPAEVKAVQSDFLLLKARFLDKGIPVVLGEFGVSTNKDPASVVKYLSTVGQTAYSLGVVPMLWDAGGLYNRRDLKWNNPQVGEALARIVPDSVRREAAQKSTAQKAKVQTPKAPVRTLKK